MLSNSLELSHTNWMASTSWIPHLNKSSCWFIQMVRNLYKGPGEGLLQEGFLLPYTSCPGNNSVSSSFLASPCIMSYPGIRSIHFKKKNGMVIKQLSYFPLSKCSTYTINLLLANNYIRNPSGYWTSMNPLGAQRHIL